MSMTIEEISGMLTRLEVPNVIDEDGDVRVIPIATENYINPKGEKTLYLYISLRNHQGMGQIFSIHTGPSLFETKGNEHRDVLLKFCSILQMGADPVQFIYMAHDASVHARIEIPLANNKLTHEQVDLCIGLMRNCIDGAFNALTQTLETGVLALPDDVRQILADAEGHPETTRL